MVACPLCGQDVSSTSAEMAFGGTTFPVYTCDHCSAPGGAFSFIMMPDGSSVSVEDYAEYCRRNTAAAPPSQP